MKKSHISRLLTKPLNKLSDNYEYYFNVFYTKINNIVCKLVYKFPFETSKIVRDFVKNNFHARCIYCNTDLQLQSYEDNKIEDHFFCPNKKDHSYQASILGVSGKKNDISIGQTLFLTKTTTLFHSTREIINSITSERGIVGDNGKIINKAILPIRYDPQLTEKINKLLLLI